MFVFVLKVRIDCVEREVLLNWMVASLYEGISEGLVCVHAKLKY